MTDNKELIEKLRAEGKQWREQVGEMPLFDLAADALEAKVPAPLSDAEREALAERIAKRIAAVDNEAGWYMAYGYAALEEVESLVTPAALIAWLKAKAAEPGHYDLTDVPEWLGYMLQELITVTDDWEYAVDDVGMHPEGDVWRQRGEKRPIHLEQILERPIRLRRWYGVDTIYRRRPAGPWEPVDVLTPTHEPDGRESDQ